MPYVYSDRQRTVTVATVRRVWAAISENPRRSKAELMRELQIGRTTLYTALYQLREAGYIDNPEPPGAWVVRVPFIVTGKESE